MTARILNRLFTDDSFSSSAGPHVNNCWVIPKNAPVCKRDVQWSDKLELEDGGYTEFRISVDDGGSRHEASVYVQDAQRALNSVDWNKAAWGLFGAHSGLRVCHPDGSSVER
ncbi:MAG: hypothetical protein ABI664_14765 [bacterium]